MKKSLIIIFDTCLTICSLKTLAQKETRKWGIGILFEGGLSVGNTANTYNLTSGASVRFFYRAGPGFVTLSTSAVAWLSKNLLPALSDTTGQILIISKQRSRFPSRQDTNIFLNTIFL